MAFNFGNVTLTPADDESLPAFEFGGSVIDECVALSESMLVQPPRQPRHHHQHRHQLQRQQPKQDASLLHPCTSKRTFELISPISKELEDPEVEFEYGGELNDRHGEQGSAQKAHQHIGHCSAQSRSWSMLQITTAKSGVATGTIGGRR